MKLTALFRKGNEDMLDRTYEMYRQQFVRFAAKRCSLPEETVLDIFQEGFVAFYNNVASGRVQDSGCSARTYLFQICRNKLNNYLRDNRHYAPIGDAGDITVPGDESYDEEKREIVVRAVQAMGEKCRRVLTMYYWQRLSMKDIAREMGYRNEQIAKNRKHSCMETIREQIKEIFREKGLL